MAHPTVMTYHHVASLPPPNRSCLEMTARMNNIANTVAATTILTDLGTSQMPACTQTRGIMTTLMRSSTAAQSVVITMRMMRRTTVSSQMEAARPVV